MCGTPNELGNAILTLLNQGMTLAVLPTISYKHVDSPPYPRYIRLCQALRPPDWATAVAKMTRC